MNRMLLDLLARAEKATGADRDIDRDLALATGQLHEGELWGEPRLYKIEADGSHTYGGTGDDILIGDFTGDTDTALRLVRQLLHPQHPGMTINLRAVLDSRGEYWWAEITWPSHERQGRGPTAPLALCAALLRALADPR